MRIFITLAIVAAICTGCTTLSTLEPANKIAVENQKNLCGNTKLVLEQLVTIARSHPDFDPTTDEAKLTAMCKVILEQVAISTAYVALIDGMLQDKLEIDDFVRILDKVPGLISSGKDLWAEIENITKENK